MWAAEVLGPVLGVVLFVKRKRARVIDPDRTDPARNFRLLKFALLALIGGVVALAWGLSSSSSVGVPVLMVAVAVYLVGVVLINLRAAILRRATEYVICEDSYESAPRAIKTSMGKIYKASAAIESTRAYHDGMFGDLDVSRLTYSAAQRAVLSSELAASTADSVQKGSSTRFQDAQAAKVRQQNLLAEVREVERSLGRAQIAANKLSHDLDEPARVKAAQLASVQEQQRSDEVKRRLDAVNARIDAVSELNARDVEDRVSSVQAGYAEAREISSRATGAAAKPPNSDESRPTPDSVSGGIRTTLKSTALGTGRLAKTALVRLGKSLK